ncbi:MAG: dihydroorotate dehydrogenase [Ignavibacteria bacterium]|nr:dihydroorotate dehydrogenase [Ignavibacteria bacterium]
MIQPSLEVQLGSLKLKNPVLVASGTFGYGLESKDFTDVNKIGGIVTKSLSLKPRKGNPPPRICETPAGMLNAIGLANIGVERFLKEKLPELNKLDTKLIVNIAASSIDEYVECVRLMTNEKIDAFEINVSCPNVHEGGLEFGRDVKKVAEITNRVVSVSSKPIIIKLTPNVTFISEYAKAAKEEGAAAVSAINTFVGMAINIQTRKPKLSHNTGGLSGPAIKPLAIAKVFEIKKNVDVPIIGIGGITNYEDVIEFMLAGASAVQVGTHNFVIPNIAEKIVQDLIQYCTTNRIEEIKELIGSVQLF